MANPITALRNKNNSAPNIPEIKLDGEKPAVAIGVSAEIPPEAAPNAADEATARLQRQIEELKQSEELQRRHAAQMARAQQQEQAVNFWRQNGVTDAQLRFLLAAPGALDQLTDLASHEAVQQGHQYGTATHTEAAVKIFRDRLDHLESQAASNASVQPTPREPPPFRPPPPSLPAEPDRASIISAPVSREAPSASGSRKPGPIRLTADQKEAARLANISEVEYARQLQRLHDEKSAGSYAEHRYR